MKYLIRIPNFADVGDKKKYIKKFNVFSQFVKMISHNSEEKMLLRFYEVDYPTQGLLEEKGCSYLNFRDMNNPWINGSISGSSSQIKRFLEEAKNKIVVKNHLKLVKGTKVYLEANEISGKIEYISEHKPHAFILINEEGESLGFQGIEEEIVHREISKNIV